MSRSRRPRDEKSGDVARFLSISATRLTGERIRNPRLLGRGERRRPLDCRDDLGQHFFVQPALDPALVGRQLGDDFRSRQAQYLVTGNV